MSNRFGSRLGHRLGSSALAAVVLLTTALLPAAPIAPVAAAPSGQWSDDWLAGWTFSVRLTHTYFLQENVETEIVTYIDDSSQSTALRWEATYTSVGKAGPTCKEWKVEGKGSGVGEFMLGSTGPPHSGWDPSVPFTTVVAQPVGGFSVYGGWDDCEGTIPSSGGSGKQTLPALVLLPGTVETLRSLPVGTRIERTYSWVRPSSPGTYGETTEVSYTAVKMIDTGDVEHDSDGDGLSDDEERRLGTDPQNPDSDGDGLRDGEEVGLGTLPTNPDSDGDRLGDGREVRELGTNAMNADSDGDGFSDPTELAAGSDPMNPAETPNNVSIGASALAPGAQGQVGISCGTTRFEWVSVALEPVGIPSNANACILLVGNETANGIFDLVLHHGTDVSTVLAGFVGPYFLESAGEVAVDWGKDHVDEVVVWGYKREAKKALLKALNLSRFNTYFTIGTVAALIPLPFVAHFMFEEVRRDNACLAVKLGDSSNGQTVLDWHLVFSSEHTDDADLSYAGVRDKVEQAWAFDDARFERSNLRCVGGVVTESGSPTGMFVDGSIVTAIY